MAHGLIVGQAGLWLARQCVLAYAGLFSNERKKSVAESVRKTKGLSGAFWGPRALFQKALKNYRSWAIFSARTAALAKPSPDNL